MELRRQSTANHSSVSENRIVVWPFFADTCSIKRSEVINLNSMLMNHRMSNKLVSEGLLPGQSLAYESDLNHTIFK